MSGLFHTVANTPFRVKLGAMLVVVVFACLPAAADSITFSALSVTTASLGSSPNISTLSITGSTQQLPLSTKKPLSADLVANLSAAAN
jgi:ABC-type phosphate transport system substrate-binding protein